MADTGATYPSSGTNVDNAGASAWNSPGNIVGDNGADATIAGSGASGSDYLVASGFGFAIPTGSTIDGILVEIEASEHATGTEDLFAQLQDETGALVGSSKSQTISGTTKVVYSYGGAADIWGTGGALSAEDVNDADFGVRAWFSTAHSLAVDFIRMTVTYTPPSGFKRSQVMCSY